MYFKDILNILYVPHTASEHTVLSVVPFNYPRQILWKGEAKDIKKWSGANNNWIVVEIKIDESDFAKEERGIPKYNWNKVIVVI